MGFEVGKKVRHKNTGKILKVLNIYDDDDVLECTDGFSGSYYLAFSVAEPYTKSLEYRQELVALTQFSSLPTRSRQWQDGFLFAIESALTMLDAFDFDNED